MCLHGVYLSVEGEGEFSCLPLLTETGGTVYHSVMSLDAKSCLHTFYYDVKKNILKDYCPSDLKLMLSLSDAEKRSLPGPESDGTRRIMEMSSNIDKKVDDNSVTDPLPAPADEDSNSENSNPPYELLPAKTRSRTEPFDVHGLLSGAMIARDTDPDFALALQKCREENSILSIAVNVHNRRIDHSANQAKHIPIYGSVDYFSVQPFFTITLLQM